MKKIILALFLFWSSIYADYGIWFSSSFIWGQGNFGGFYRINSLTVVTVSEYFVWDWGDNQVDYNSERLAIDYKNYSLGIFLRKDRVVDSEQEISPFISYYSKVEEVSIYQSLEYRYQNLLNVQNYFRHELSASYDFAKYQKYDFFIKSSSFVNVNEVDLEKQLFYLGIKRVDKVATLSLYIIPYKYGNLGQEWDDISYVGGSFVYKF